MRSEYILTRCTESKCTVSLVRINGQGYDSTGFYWGVGAPLWCVEARDGEDAWRRTYVRAESREEAKRLFPRARWCR